MQPVPPNGGLHARNALLTHQVRGKATSCVYGHLCCAQKLTVLAVIASCVDRFADSKKACLSLQGFVVATVCVLTTVLGASETPGLRRPNVPQFDIRFRNRS